MKASELVAILNKAIEQYCDHEVHVEDDGHMVDVGGLLPECDAPEGEVRGYYICSPEALNGVMV